MSAAANARSVAHAIRLLPGRSVARSRLFRTPAWPPGSGPGFVNAAVVLWSPVPPMRLLARLHAIEARAGRVRGLRWSARVLDLDLLASGARVLPDRATQAIWRQLSPERQAREAPGRLILPHPRLQDRAFVLIPLAEVAAAWRHPVTGRRVADMVARLRRKELAQIRPLGARDGVVNRKRRS